MQKPLKKADSMYVEVIGINMVDIVENFGRQLPVEKPTLDENPQADDEMVTEDHQSTNALVTEDKLIEKMEVAYPKLEEDLIDVDHQCHERNYQCWQRRRKTGGCFRNGQKTSHRKDISSLAHVGEKLSRRR